MKDKAQEILDNYYGQFPVKEINGKPIHQIKSMQDCIESGLIDVYNQALNDVLNKCVKKY
jgi:hypothetical protein